MFHFLYNIKLYRKEIFKSVVDEEKIPLKIFEESINKTTEHTTYIYNNTLFFDLVSTIIYYFIIWLIIH